MRTKIPITSGLIVIALIAIFPHVNADTLASSDFAKQSFYKTVDYFDYARYYAGTHNMTVPPTNWHANVYMTYVNTRGLQMLYAGLDNITFSDDAAFTVPMQTFIMHYKTQNNQRDVITASTFLTMLAFNEAGDSIYENSPDMNDTLWASFSMGANLDKYGATLPALNSKTLLTPLTHSADNLTWTWGMKYTNLTAFWWGINISTRNPQPETLFPTYISVYDELSFTYTLTIDPTAHKATLREDHTIGRMLDLFQRILIPWIHYNSTGMYWPNGEFQETPNIYEFLQNNGVQMSIVDFQNTVLLDHDTYSQTPTGQNVTDQDQSVTDMSIGTYADDGEKIIDASFNTKKTYQLFNYTSDPTEETGTTYNATARTSRIYGFAHNLGLFENHVNFMKFLPLLVLNMHPELYERARETVCNMSRANYFYIIGYPEYSGYRVVHDPTLTVYLTVPATEPGGNPPPNWGGLMLVAAIIAVIVVTGIFVIRRRKARTDTETAEPAN